MRNPDVSELCEQRTHSLTLCHVSSHAHVQKQTSRQKVCPQTKHGEKASIWCLHLKGENQPQSLQQGSPLSDGLQKPPCRRWSLKPPVQIELRCICCSVAKFFTVFHVGGRGTQRLPQWSAERKGTAEMYGQIFLSCILQEHESYLRLKPHKSDGNGFLLVLAGPDINTTHLLLIAGGQTQVFSSAQKRFLEVHYRLTSQTVFNHSRVNQFRQ